MGTGAREDGVEIVSDQTVTQPRIQFGHAAFYPTKDRPLLSEDAVAHWKANTEREERHGCEIGQKIGGGYLDRKDAKAFRWFCTQLAGQKWEDCGAVIAALRPEDSKYVTVEELMAAIRTAMAKE